MVTKELVFLLKTCDCFPSEKDSFWFVVIFSLEPKIQPVLASTFMVPFCEPSRLIECATPFWLLDSDFLGIPPFTEISAMPFSTLFKV